MTKHRTCPAIVAGSVLSLLALGVACRSRPTTASRSAAAYDQAQREGKPIEKGGHGGHAAPVAAASATERAKAEAPPLEMDHPRTEHDAHAPSMAEMDHAHMTGKQGSPAMSTMDHSHMAAQQNAEPMAGMDHSKMTGMDHSPATPPDRTAMDHSAMGHPANAAPAEPEPASAVAWPGQPAVTLRQDERDGPAPTSLRDAESAAAMAKEMAGGMQHGAPYRQLDAGRAGAPAPSPSPTPSPRHQHEGHR